MPDRSGRAVAAASCLPYARAVIAAISARSTSSITSGGVPSAAIRIPRISNGSAISGAWLSSASSPSRRAVLASPTNCSIKRSRFSELADEDLQDEFGKPEHAAERKPEQAGPQGSADHHHQGRRIDEGGEIHGPSAFHPHDEQRSRPSWPRPSIIRRRRRYPFGEFRVAIRMASETTLDVESWQP